MTQKMFRVGQKVVCIKDEGQTVPPYVKKNAIYTIAEIKELIWFGTGLEFVELGPCCIGGCFPACYFRPVVERKTDISVFTDILHKTKVPELT